MVPRLPIHKRLLLLGFHITGIVAGIIFLTPRNSGDKFLGGIAGFICALLASFLIFQDLRNMLPKIWDGSNIYGINMKNYFVHPTQIPMLLGILWFILFIFLVTPRIFNFITDNFQGIEKSEITGLLLTPSALLIGLSGFLIFKRNEAIDRFGEIHKGARVRFIGISTMFLGWGIGALFVLSAIFKW